MYLDGKPVSTASILPKDGQNSEGLYGFTETTILHPNIPHTLEIHGDISSGTASNSILVGDTIKIILLSPANSYGSCNATGQRSIVCINVPVSSTYGNTLTVVE